MSMDDKPLHSFRCYRKAVKATAVLIPLLGGTYILLYWPYNFSEELPRAAWMYSTAFIQSVQVSYHQCVKCSYQRKNMMIISALIYCNLNICTYIINDVA